ncbi:MAG TPA: hypothetical protein PKU78_06690 [Candidatus Dojkabacteria bacterium]|nr:hypothetical protein [Candidatus Dojkabacteria bacterium]HRO65886.1 hypothetical protein [Candidatus Dojkabacteria bacterium]HRP37772.1 hypothetical protein [Candidatus Dojkabacteria bacterium]HRP51283.1 hypothetical protein [Candidatus Dojkabacteria bacterium]
MLDKLKHTFSRAEEFYNNRINGNLGYNLMLTAGLILGNLNMNKAYLTGFDGNIDAFASVWLSNALLVTAFASPFIGIGLDIKNRLIPARKEYTIAHQEGNLDIIDEKYKFLESQNKIMFRNFLINLLPLIGFAGFTSPDLFNGNLNPDNITPTPHLAPQFDLPAPEVIPNAPKLPKGFDLRA